MTTESAPLGSMPAVTAEVVRADIQSTTLSIDELVDAVRHPSAGAVVIFVGYVRNRDHGEAVEVLDYTCHPSAEQVARGLAGRLAADGRTIRLGVVHRVGHLTVGDIAVVAAVSAAHRGEAFDVCAALIDEFKRTVPIWKHQVFTDGSDEWVGLP
jgi:molybdopterin synthase catalytic subunit